MMRVLTWIGGGAMVAAALLDGLGVLGRHTGLPLHGVIELVQAAILITGCVALVAATVAGSHARVHFLLERLPLALRTVTEAGGQLLSALFFAALLAGGLWLSADLWAGHEMSELIGVPYRWLRVATHMAVGAVVLLLLRDAIRRRPL